jgi:hypothetical protein
VIGVSFLLLSVLASVASGSSPWPIVVGLVLGWAAMAILIATGQAVPGGRTSRASLSVGIGATIGVGIAALASSALGLLDPAAPRLFAVGGLALLAGFAFGIMPSLMRGREEVGG